MPGQADKYEGWNQFEADIAANGVIRIDHDFIVFINKANSLYWATSKRYDETKLTDDHGRHNLLLIESAKLEEAADKLGEKPRLACLRLIGESIALTLARDYPNAQRMVDDASAF